MRRREHQIAVPERPVRVKVAESADQSLLIEEIGSVLFIRALSEGPLPRTSLLDMERVSRLSDRGVTVIISPCAQTARTKWAHLDRLLDALQISGVAAIRFVLPGKGGELSDQLALARRTADERGIAVMMHEARVVLVPGGSLFATRTGSAVAGWQLFQPGQGPVALGGLWPRPSWRKAIDHLPDRVTDGWHVERIPAGVLLRPAHSRATDVADLAYRVPVDMRRPVVIVGGPDSQELPGDAVVDTLLGLPAALRPLVRLVPGNTNDLLPLARVIANMLDTAIEVFTGLPLMYPDGPARRGGVRAVVVGVDGRPAWCPFVDSALCRPAQPGRAAPDPQLLGQHNPMRQGGQFDAAVTQLQNGWQVAVTRAGLWMGRLGQRAPLVALPVSSAGPVIELGSSGEVLDSTVWPVLEQLLDSFAPDLTRASIHLHGETLDGGRELRRLAAERGIATIRYGEAKPARTALPRPILRNNAHGASTSTSGETGRSMM